ncbi:hypothetical protein LTS18_015143, partial [Coniosporium uncinatum]
MQKFSHCVVLTRVGNFYELYFEHAEEYAPLLAIKLGKKNTNAGPVPMAGFPYFQIDRFLKILVQDLNKYVAISEEFANNPEERSKLGGNLFDRKVTRVITPGTLIDEKFMDPWENNFLLSITADSGALEPPQSLQAEASVLSPRLGLSWVDVSSGDFFTQESDVLGLASVIARVGPREIVIDSRLRDMQHSALAAILKQDNHILTYHEIPASGDELPDWQNMLAEEDTKLEPQRFKPLEFAAGNLLLHY